MQLPYHLPDGSELYSKPPARIDDLFEMSHNAEDFGLQNHPFYVEGVQKRVSKGKILAQEIADEVEQYERVDSKRAIELVQSARRLSNLDGARTRSIAFLGDSGQGTNRPTCSILSRVA